MSRFPKGLVSCTVSAPGSSLPLNGPRSVASDGKNVYVAGYFSDSLAEISLKDACKSRAIP